MTRYSFQLSNKLKLCCLVLSISVTTTWCFFRERKMIRSLLSVLMIQSTSTTMTSKSFLLIAYQRSAASLKTVSLKILPWILKARFSYIKDHLWFICIMWKFGSFNLIWTDKKNENKEVAVNDFLPSTTATEAIQYSM